MTPERDHRDTGGSEAALAARHNWIAELLGEQWCPEGGGVYRFVGGQRAAAPGEPTGTLDTAPRLAERGDVGRAR